MFMVRALHIVFLPFLGKLEAVAGGKKKMGKRERRTPALRNANVSLAKVKSRVGLGREKFFWYQI